MRLDQHLAAEHPEYSRSTWQKLIKQGQVRVDGEVVLQPKHDILDSNVVTASTPEAPDFSADSLPIIFEDDDVLLIDKPAGVLTHSKGTLNDEFSVAEFVRPKTSYKTDTNRPGIIHRLDRATSGVILTVKHEAAATMLMKQFQRRTVQKTYYAVVQGIPKQPSAVIDVPIGRNPKAPSTFRADPNGKPAQTDYEVIATNGERSLVKLQPRTGRTHQLRVHLAYIGCPIVGDVAYGAAADRMYLHAAALELTLPSNEHMTFSSPVPPSFQLTGEMNE